jgi:hypothetical protein
MAGHPPFDFEAVGLQAGVETAHVAVEVAQVAVADRAELADVERPLRLSSGS